MVGAGLRFLGGDLGAGGPTGVCPRVQAHSILVVCGGGGVDRYGDHHQGPQSTLQGMLRCKNVFVVQCLPAVRLQYCGTVCRGSCLAFTSRMKVRHGM